MRTSGAGKGGVFAAVVGAVALGATACASGGSGNTTAMEHAAAGATDSTSTPSATSPSPTATDTGNASQSSSSSAPSSSSSSSTSSTPSPKPSTTTPKPAPSTTTTTPKPPANTGSGWLSGVPLGSNTPGPLDSRCLTGRVICIDMSTRTLLWVIDGKVQYGMDVRFGDENNPTRKGKFDIYMKMKDCISTIYHTPMPDAMFFSGGEAVHFSIDFKTYGYAHHSHGCVNVRNRAAVDQLFADTRVGDTVVVY